MEQRRKIKGPLIALICLISLIIGIVMVSKDKVSLAVADVNNFEVFKNAKASDLLGSKLLTVSSHAGMTYYDLMKAGQYGCLSHKNVSQNSGDDNYVNSVYDVVFKKDEDDVRKLSIQSVGRGMGSKVAYGGKDTEGKAAIRLALQMAQTRNMEGVYDALRAAASAGVVVRDPAVMAGHDNIVAGGGTTAIDDDLADEYTSYKRLTKVDLENDPEVKSATVKKGGHECTIIGPFKMKVGGKKITKITVGDAKWTPDNKDEIFWSTTPSENASEWNSSFNTKKEGTSRHAIDGTKFYLAIRTSKLPTEGNSELVIEQEKFEFFSARLIVTCSNYQQQMACYYTGDKETEEGKATWKIPPTGTIGLTILKRDATTKKPLKGAEFRIKCGTDKWLSKKNGKYKYDSTKDDKDGIFVTNEKGEIVLDKLKSGKYWVYETKAPEGYSLEIQEGYNPSNKWVLCTKDPLQLKKDYTLKVNNIPVGLTIIKKDEAGKPLDAGFAVYSETKKGWVLGKDGKYTYNNSYSTAKATPYKTGSEGTITLNGLKAGTYHVYEIEAPKGYDLAKQGAQYKETLTVGTETITKVVDCGSQTLNTANKSIKFEVVNKLSSRQLTIIKKDESGKPLKAGFAVFKVGKTDTDGGWLQGTAGKYKLVEYEEAVKTPYYSDGGTLTLTDLEDAEYMIYEIEAPEGYDLASQKGVISKDSRGKDIVYWDKATLSEANKNPTIEIVNRKNGLTIKKEDLSGNPLNAGFKLYYSGTAETGWITGSNNKYTISSSFGGGGTYSTSGGSITLEGVPAGVYMIYEVTLPSGYKWANQEGYAVTRNVGGQYISSPTVYCGTVSISSDNPSGSISKVNIKDGDTGRGKKNEFGQLMNASFKLYDVNQKKWITQKKGYWTKEREYHYVNNVNTEYVDSKTGYSLAQPYSVTDVWNEEFVRKELTPELKAQFQAKSAAAKARCRKSSSSGPGYSHSSVDTYEFSFREWSYYDYTDKANEAATFGTNQYIEIIAGGGDAKWPSGATSTTYEIFEVGCSNDYRLKYQYNYNSYNLPDPNRWRDFHGLKDARYIGRASPEDSTVGTYQMGLDLDQYKSQSLKWAAPTTPTGEGHWYINDDQYHWKEKPDYDSKDQAKLWIETVNNNSLAIKGTVWEDAPLTKAHTYNSLYDKNGGSGKAADDSTIEERTEKGLGGIKVRIKEGSTVVATTTTASDGTYTFNKNQGIKINKLDDDKYTIEFDYSKLFTGNKDDKKNNGVFTGDKYIPVKYYENVRCNNNENVYSGSKAKAGDIPYSDADLPKMAYSASLKKLVYMEWQRQGMVTYTVGPSNMDATLHYVNFGLKKLPETSFGITKDIDTVQIKMIHKDNDSNAKKYTYTYKYGRNKKDFIEKSFTPTVKWQNKNDYTVYSTDIYPSDVGYSSEKNYNSDGIEVYVKYRIDIVNTVTYNIEELYMESDLWVESLKNKFDTNRYKLSDDNWKNTSSGEATITDRYLKDVFGTGIQKYKGSDPNSCVRTAYITYRVTNDELDRVIKSGTTHDDSPTKVWAQGYHKYKRLEHTWKQEGQTINHKTVSMTRNSEAPGMTFSLGQDRDLTGKVFEDKVTSESTNKGEKLGNGKYDGGESSVGGVKVELIDIKDIHNVQDLERKNPTTLYWVEGGTVRTEEAVRTTKSDGTYKFRGVVPGKYVLRFTYGDGSVIYSSPTKTATIDKYKSTIVTDSAAKEALRNAPPTSDFWYRDVRPDAEYSVAVDDKEIRKNFNRGGDSTRENRGDSSISEIFAYADVMSIAIENTHATSGEANGNASRNFVLIDRMNLGIVVQPKHELTLKKVITNIKLTNVQNNVILEGNPQTDAGKLKGVTDLDMNDSNQGSTFTRIESDEEQITELVPTYTITIEDISDIVYYSLDKAHENWYYDFGEHNPSYSRVIAVDPSEVIDYLDPSLEYMTTIYKYDRGRYFGNTNYEIESEPGYRAGYGNANLLNISAWSITDEKTEQLDFKSGTWKSPAKTYNNIAGYVTGEENSTGYKYRTLLDFTKMNSLIRNDKIIITMSAKRVFQSDDDTETLNSAQITVGELPQKVVDNPLVQKVILAKDNDNGAYSTTKITITPPTGEDKKAITIYIITGISALVVLTTGVVIVKKKLL